MALLQPRDEEPLSPSFASYAPFPTAPLIEENNLLTFITDFDWLRSAWRVLPSLLQTPRNPLPLLLDLTGSLYSVEDLVRLYGYSAWRTHNLLDEYGIAPQSSCASPRGRAGRHALLPKQDLIPVTKKWEWKRLPLGHRRVVATLTPLSVGRADIAE